MYSQMGNDHSKGSNSGERKKKKQHAKESTTLGDLSNVQERENGDQQKVSKEGARLFWEEKAKRKDFAKDLNERLKIKSEKPVSEAERQEAENRAGSNSLSSSNDTVMHNNAVNQGDKRDMNHGPPPQDSFRSKMDNGNEPDGSLIDRGLNQSPLSATHTPGNESNRVYGGVLLGGPEINGDPVPSNMSDLATSVNPETLPQAVQNNTSLVGPSQIMNGSFPDNNPEPIHDEPTEVVPQEVHNSAPPSGTNGPHSDPGMVSNQAPEDDSNRGHTEARLVDQGTVCNPVQGDLNLAPNHASSRADTGAPLGDQGTVCNPVQGDLNLAPNHASSRADTGAPLGDQGTVSNPVQGDFNLVPNHASSRADTGAPLGDQGTVSNPVQGDFNLVPNCASSRSDAGAPLDDQNTAIGSVSVNPVRIGRDQHEAIQPSLKIPTTGDDLTHCPEKTEGISDTTSSLTPQSKIESSTPPGMQIVPGLTREKKADAKEDAEKWKVTNQLISRAVTDNTLLLEKLSKYLDRESRVIKCWKHLAFVLKVPAEETRKFDIYTEHSPTEDLFNYLGDIWNPDLKVKELKVKLKAVYRNDIIDSLNKGGFRDEEYVSDLMSGRPKFIALLSPKLDIESRTIGNWKSLATQFGIRKQKIEQFGLRGSGPTGALFLHMRTTEGLRDLTMGQLRGHFQAVERKDLVNLLEKQNFEDSCLVMNVVVEGSELLAEIGERLNKDVRAVKNWRNLAYKLKIPHEVYDAFDTSKGAAKSPTKMLFEWLARWKPNLSVGDLLTGLKQIDRYDVVDLVTKETTVTLETVKRLEADSRQKCTDFRDGTTQQSTAKQVFSDLQQMHRDADKLHKETDLSHDLTKNAALRGFIIIHNPGQGNCMFHALSEQLDLKQIITISHEDLRRNLVQYLREHPQLPDGTDLFNFVDGCSSWTLYLEMMEKDGTCGDHVILMAAANCYNCVIRVISSLPNCSDVIIRPDPPVCDAAQLVLGHIHEVHYVSLVPFSSVPSWCSQQQMPLDDGWSRIIAASIWHIKEFQAADLKAQNVGAVPRGNYQVPAENRYDSRHLQSSRYGGPPPPDTTSVHLMQPRRYQQPKGYQQPQGHQQPHGYQQPQGYPQPASQNERYFIGDKNFLAVRKLPYKVYSKICIKLNLRREWSFDDFRMVAEQLGMDRDTTEYVGQDKNPSHRIFVDYCPNVTVRELIEILHKIERVDVADELEDWLKEA